MFHFQDSFCTLKHLVRLDLSKNGLTELPAAFGQLEQLQRLDLFSNQLSSLPTSCVHLRELKWLDLKGNPIQTLLPDIVGDCLKPDECRRCARNVSYLQLPYTSLPSFFKILFGCELIDVKEKIDMRVVQYI